LKNKLKPLVLIGGGGHASVLADILIDQGREILAVISPNELSSRKVFSGIQHFSKDEELECFSPENVLLVNGIGMMPRSVARKTVNQKFLKLGYEFETVISSDAIVSSFSVIQPGVQIFSGAIIQTGAIVSEHTIINTGAVIEHDCCIGRYNHIAPNATLSGGVKTEDEVFVGANSTILQDCKLGELSVVGAGVTLTKDLGTNLVAYPSRTEIKCTKDLK